MVVGDTVSICVNTTQTFQPASSVQICITQFFTNSSDVYYSYIRGAGDIFISTPPYFSQGSGSSTAPYNWANHVHKLFITNTSYIQFYSLNNQWYNGFSGIQTQ